MQRFVAPAVLQFDRLRDIQAGDRDLENNEAKIGNLRVVLEKNLNPARVWEQPPGHFPMWQKTILHALLSCIRCHFGGPVRRFHCRR